MKRKTSTKQYFHLDDPQDVACNGPIFSRKLAIPAVMDQDFGLPIASSDQHLHPHFNAHVITFMTGAQECLTDCWSQLSIELHSSPAICEHSSLSVDRDAMEAGLRRIELVLNQLDIFARLAIKSNTRNFSPRERDHAVMALKRLDEDIRQALTEVITVMAALKR
jgi:hypothetical protein